MRMEDLPPEVRRRVQAQAAATGGGPPKPPRPSRAESPADQRMALRCTTCGKEFRPPTLGALERHTKAIGHNRYEGILPGGNP